MRKLSSLLGGLVLAALVGAGTIAAPLTTQFTGPAGSNPINFPADLADVNAALNQIQQGIGAAIAMSSGPTGVATWVTNANLISFTNAAEYSGASSLTQSVSLTTGLNYPTGLGSTTVKFFLTILDSAGKPGYIPVWQ